MSFTPTHPKARTHGEVSRQTDAVTNRSDLTTIRVPSSVRLGSENDTPETSCHEYGQYTRDKNWLGQSVL